MAPMLSVAVLDERPGCAFDVSDDIETLVGDMAEYPRFAYTTKAVRRAGERLGGSIHLDESSSQDERASVLETFAIANSWRDSHVYPMRSLRFSLIQRKKGLGFGGFTAARPKRMSSIRRKLRTMSLKLDQMNDLGGCRAVMDDIRGVRAVLDICRSEQFPHDRRQEYAYIDEPKADGYRSHHIVFSFRGRGETESFDGRRIELQVRTRLQHSWATAVEAVGLYRGEDLKSGAGSDEWRRLFALVAGEFSVTEDCPVHPSLPTRPDRIAEIKDLNRRLNAASTLENIISATHFAENFIHEKQRFYLIRYGKDRTVSVEGYTSPIVGTVDLGELEMQIESGADDSKVVLVETDAIGKLVEAYPNYFGDVSLFVRNLKHICSGEDAIEYSMSPQKTVAPLPKAKRDLSWLNRRYTHWTEKR